MLVGPKAVASGPSAERESGSYSWTYSQIALLGSPRGWHGDVEPPIWERLSASLEESSLLLKSTKSLTFDGKWTGLVELASSWEANLICWIKTRYPTNEIRFRLGFLWCLERMSDGPLQCKIVLSLSSGQQSDYKPYPNPHQVSEIHSFWPYRIMQAREVGLLGL